MCPKVFWLAFIACLVVVPRGGHCFEAKRFFGVGQRLPGDQLLVKDVQHSRPAGAGELPRVEFTYEILEPITYVEILAEENISAEVKFSLVNRLVVGMVQLAGSNQSDEAATIPPVHEFDVTIMVFGLNGSAPNYDVSLVINRDQQFEGQLEPFDELDIEAEDDLLQERFDHIKRDGLEVEEALEHELADELEAAEEAEGHPTTIDDFESSDKVIERGKRQPGDQLLYETYQTSSEESKTLANHSLAFYYIDTNSITYVKFVIFDHYSYNNYSNPEYLPPVVEFSHFSRGTLKAVVTDYESFSLFVQMFIYGYRAGQVPATYVPFLPAPNWQKEALDEHKHIWTPLQKMQLLLLTGQMTTPPADDDSDHGEQDEVPRTMRPDEMLVDHSELAKHNTNSALCLDQLHQGLGALVGLLLLILHN